MWKGKEKYNQKQTWSVTLINGQSRICRQTSNFQLIRMQICRFYMLEGVSGTVPNGGAMCGGRGSRMERKRG